MAEHLNGGPIPGVSTLKDWSYPVRPGYYVCTAEAPQTRGGAWEKHPDAVFDRQFYQANWWGAGENDVPTTATDWP